MSLIELRAVLKEYDIETETVVPLQVEIYSFIERVIDKARTLSVLKKENNLTLETLDETLQLEVLGYRDENVTFTCSLFAGMNKDVKLRLSQVILFHLYNIVMEIHASSFSWDDWNQWKYFKDEEDWKHGMVTIINCTAMEFTSLPITEPSGRLIFAKLVTVIIRRLIKIAYKLVQYQSDYDTDVFLRFVMRYYFPSEIYKSFSISRSVIDLNYITPTVLRKELNRGNPNRGNPNRGSNSRGSNPRGKEIKREELYFYERVVQSLFEMFSDNDLDENDMWRILENSAFQDLIKEF